jgi:hypothetical protein
MIELKKYTIGTYDPGSLAINQRTDFTRRIPTGLSDKQMARAEKLIRQLVNIENDARGAKAQRMIILFYNNARLLGNPHYWEIMRTVWVMAGNTETAEMFRRMMKSSRPCKGWFMTPEDAAALDAMQFPLTVWRAYDAKRYPDDTDPGISWTINEQWCREYAAFKGRVVKSRTVERSDIFAYISRRGEEEIIIL